MTQMYTFVYIVVDNMYYLSQTDTSGMCSEIVAVMLYTISLAAVL